MSWSTELFQTSKPIIGLLHLDSLPEILSTRVLWSKS